MYNSVLIVIQSGEYNLSDLAKKIDTLWLKSYLTDDERESLTKLAIEKASPDSGLPSYSERLASLEKRVSKLEGGSSSGGDSGSSDWPEWVRPTGAHDSYAKGSQVTHYGEKYISQIDANVWEPGVFGSESLWAKQA
uniref:Uncharacterized protein n=1 Tax=Siphoviridae sp. ctWWc42 TaxID=2826361 RepID=A0A8S5R2W4_9CAUD|nr:MAG TPA: hypothetical protein [Siphoviridae sp. ctWWc42]